MTKRTFSFAICLAAGLLFAWLLAACIPAPQLTPATLPTNSPEPGAAPTQTATLPPTQTPSLPSGPTSTPKPTRTPRERFIVKTDTPAPTATPVGSWQVPVVNLPQFSRQSVWVVDWLNEASVVLDVGKQSNIVLNASSGEIIAEATPMPEMWSDAWFNLPASTEEFEIRCSNTGLEMFRLSDGQLISQTDLVSSDCHGIHWANDNSAAAFTTKWSETDLGDVYVWRTDGSAPDLLAEDKYFVGGWAPDSQRILLVGREAGNMDADKANFYVAYPDGRPVNMVAPVIEAGNEWGEGHINWVTNEVVLSFRGCGMPNYCLQDFFHAEAGKFLFRNEIAETGGQDVFISPDGRWAVVENPQEAASVEDIYTNSNGNFPGQGEIPLALYDLKSVKKSVWLKSQALEPLGGEFSFKFAGWNADSTRFYFVHFPYGNLPANLPYGLLELDPQTLKTQLVVPNVIFSSLSPDGQSIFLVTAGRINPNLAFDVQAGLYSLDGRPLAEPHFIADQLPFDYLNPTDFLNEGAWYDPYPDLFFASWNEASDRAILALPSGEIWEFDLRSSVRPIVLNVPAQKNLLEDTRFHWSPNGRFLIIMWGGQVWIAQLHQP